MFKQVKPIFSMPILIHKRVPLLNAKLGLTGGAGDMFKGLATINELQFAVVFDPRLIRASQLTEKPFHILG